MTAFLRIVLHDAGFVAEFGVKENATVLGA